MLTRTLGVVVGAVVAVVLTTAPAAAHNSLTSTAPRSGQVVGSTPSSVVLTYDQPVLGLGTRVVVTGPDGEAQSGPVRVVDNVVTQDLRPGLPAGQYSVAWRATSADGHPIEGTFTFTATSSAAPTADSATAESSPPAEAIPPQGRPAWLVAAVAIGVLGVALAVVLGVVRLRERRRGGT